MVIECLLANGSVRLNGLKHPLDSLLNSQLKKKIEDVPALPDVNMS